MSILQEILLGSMAPSAPRGPGWQIEPTEQDIALDEGEKINRLMAQVAALRSGGQYRSVPRSKTTTAGGIAGDAPLTGFMERLMAQLAASKINPSPQFDSQYRGTPRSQMAQQPPDAGYADYGNSAFTASPARQPNFQLPPPSTMASPGNDAYTRLVSQAAPTSSGALSSAGDPAAPGPRAGDGLIDDRSSGASPSTPPLIAPGARGAPRQPHAPIHGRQSMISALSIGEIVKAAQAAGETPIEFYRNRVPVEKRSKGVVHTLAYGLATPSNGETREMAQDRAQRMAGGYVNGQPAPSGPAADLARTQFWFRGGNRTPETTADLAAIDARTQQYAQQIRGHGGSSDFNPAGAYGQAERSMGEGTPEDRRMRAMQSSLRSPGDNYFAAQAQQRNPTPMDLDWYTAKHASRGASPMQQVFGADGPRGVPQPQPGMSPVQEMLTGNPQQPGAAGPSGPTGQRGMTPEDAMLRLQERQGGQYYPGKGYVTQRMMEEQIDPLGGFGEDAKVMDLARKGAGSKVSGISPEFQKELDSRKKNVEARGRVRGMMQSGKIPPDIMQDHMMLNFMQKNPEVVAEMMRQNGAHLDRGAKELTDKLEREAKTAEATSRQSLANDALANQRYELFSQTMSPEDAYMAAYGKPMPDAGGAGAPGGSGTPRAAGLEWSDHETETLTGMSGPDILAYGNTQNPPWSRDKTDRALRKFGNSAFANTAHPDGTQAFLNSPFGIPSKPGAEPAAPSMFTPGHMLAGPTGSMINPLLTLWAMYQQARQ